MRRFRPRLLLKGSASSSGNPHGRMSHESLSTFSAATVSRLPSSRWKLFSLSLLLPAIALAGPPYTTDDPEPVEYHHWEVYLAFQTFWTKGQEADGTLPQLEVNYGAAPDLQLHTIVPMAWAVAEGGPFQYGPGDIELGAKYRFVHEGDWIPQIGTFPLVELPIGSAARGLGAGHLEVLLPIWLQKSFGPWTTYGGGGYWIGNPGSQGSWYVGWQAQCQVTSWLAVGAEMYHGMAGQDGTPTDTRFNVGLIADLGDLHHILFSVGHSLFSDSAQAYIAYQLTFGPKG